MATRNANYYSVKPGRPESLKSHRTRNAALKAAGECGQIWDNDPKNLRQRQVHKSTAGTWMTAKPDESVAMDIKALIDKAGLID